MEILNAIFEGFMHILNDQGTTVFVLITMHILVIISSLTLAILMLKYRGKRALDIALLFRELAILFIIIRALSFWVFGWVSVEWGVISYGLMAVAAFSVIALLAREHYIHRDIGEE